MSTTWLSSSNRILRVVTLTDGATVTPNADTTDIGTWTIGGNRTAAAPTGTLTDGQQLMLRIKQDATGGRTVTWNSIYRFPNNTTPTLSAGANKLDVLLFQYHATDNKWDCMAVQIADVAGPVTVAVRRQSNFTLTTSGVLYAIDFSVEDVDTHGAWASSPNPSRVTPTVAGYYAVVGSTFWFNEANTTYRKTILRKNGSTTIPGTQALGAHDNGQLMSQQAPMAVVDMNGTTDYIELMVEAGTNGSQTFGNSTDGPMLAMWRLR